MESLKDQVAVVTGASGRIGKAIAPALVGRRNDSSNGLQRFRLPEEDSNRASR